VLDAYQSGRGQWAVPLPKTARRLFRSTKVTVALNEDAIRVGRGKVAQTVSWLEIVTGRVRFGAETPTELNVRLETMTTPLEFSCVLPPDGASALVGAIWERLPHRPGLPSREETLRRSRALGVQVPADIWEEGDGGIRGRGGSFELRCEHRRDSGGPSWHLSADVHVQVHTHMFFASGARRASRGEVVHAFLDDDAARAAWLLLTESPPDSLSWSDVQVCGERLTWSAHTLAQPHAVETFELALAVLAWRMMRFGANDL
jgi:hypothetical protein